MFLNVAGLLAFVLGILYLTQFRAGLIEARVQSLIDSGEIIAAAIAGSATVETDAITIDPDRLETQAGEATPQRRRAVRLRAPVNPERSRQALRKPITPTKTRARNPDRDGTLIRQPQPSSSGGRRVRFDLPPPST